MRLKARTCGQLGAPTPSSQAAVFFSSAGTDADFLEKVNSRASEHQELRHDRVCEERGTCRHTHLSRIVLAATLTRDATFFSYTCCSAPAGDWRGGVLRILQRFLAQGHKAPMK